jgi:hypothetical protein
MEEEGREDIKEWEKEEGGRNKWKSGIEEREK